MIDDIVSIAFCVGSFLPDSIFSVISCARAANISVSSLICNDCSSSFKSENASN